MRMQGYCDVYKWTILKRTSPEVKCLHLTSSRREMCMLSVSNVIYHKFSHSAAFYTLNGKNVNVMLEYIIMYPHRQDLNTVCPQHHVDGRGINKQEIHMSCIAPLRTQLNNIYSEPSLQRHSLQQRNSL